MAQLPPESSSRERSPRDRVLHVVVGHGLANYFLNAVRSVRSAAPDDQLLVVDNASPDETLRRELSKLASGDSKITLMLRESNDISRNGKVGGLYDAYGEVFAHALDNGFDYVHLMQGDMQLLWWDDDVITRAEQVYEANPRCVNIFTCLLSSSREHDGALVSPPGEQPPVLRQWWTSGVRSDEHHAGGMGGKSAIDLSHPNAYRYAAVSGHAGPPVGAGRRPAFVRCRSADTGSPLFEQRTDCARGMAEVLFYRRCPRRCHSKRRRHGPNRHRAGPAARCVASPATSRRSGTRPSET